MANMADNSLLVRAGERMSTAGQINTEFILPDSYEDIRKIITGNVTFLPGAFTLSDNKMSVSGKISLSLLFEDENGKLSNAQFVRDSEMYCARGEKGDDGEFVLAMPYVDTFSLKLQNPRKIALQVSIDSCAKLWNECGTALEMPDEFTPSDRLSVEKKEFSARTLCLSGCFEGSEQYSEDITLDRTESEIEKILMTTVNVRCEGTKREGQDLEILGSVYVKIIYMSPEGEIVCKSAKLPYSQSIECTGDIPENADFSVRVYTENIEALPAENSFGENRVVELDLSANARVICMYERECTLVGDAYSTAYLTENSEKTVKIAQRLPQVCKSENGSVSAELDEGKNPVCVLSRANVKKEGDKAFVNIKFTLLCVNEAGKLSFEELSDTIVIENLEENEFWADAVVTNEKISKNGNTVQISYTVSYCIEGWKIESLSYIESMALDGKSDMPQRKNLTVYYPFLDESLWDVAKKYRISQNALMSINELADENDIKRVMLIPKRKNSENE